MEMQKACSARGSHRGSVAIGVAIGVAMGHAGCSLCGLGLQPLWPRVAGLGERGVEEEVPPREHARHVAVRDGAEQLDPLLQGEITS